MRKTLEDLYFGNITPHDQDMTAGSENTLTDAPPLAQSASPTPFPSAF